MKTPRELLLNRHRDADPALDDLRNQSVQTLRGKTDVAHAGFGHTSDSCLVTLWQELFVACRQYWMGLGAAWCVIVLLAVVGDDGQPGRIRTTTARSEVVIQAMRDQQQMRRELLGLEWIQQASAAPRDVIPGPRSEATTGFVNV